MSARFRPAPVTPPDSAAAGVLRGFFGVFRYSRRAIALVASTNSRLLVALALCVGVLASGRYTTPVAGGAPAVAEAGALLVGRGSFQVVLQFIAQFAVDALLAE